MAAFYILAVDDREYKLKLTTASKIEAEKRLGFSLLEAPENITRAETFAVILLEVMKVSGFFSQEDLQEMEKKQETE